MNALKQTYKPLTPREAKEIARQEYLKNYHTHQAEITKDIVVQCMAAVLVSLHTGETGFGEKRLKRFLATFETTFADMGGIGFAKPYNTLDLVRQCKEDFGIDLDEFIDVEVE